MCGALRHGLVRWPRRAHSPVSHPSRTPLHCAASCNSVHLCKQLVESGAAIFASTISDIETAADKCEEMEEGYIQCSQFLYGAGPWGAPWAAGLTCAAQTPSPGSREVEVALSLRLVPETWLKIHVFGRVFFQVAGRPVWSLSLCRHRQGRTGGAAGQRPSLYFCWGAPGTLGAQPERGL